jgi:hypothetical protein
MARPGRKKASPAEATKGNGATAGATAQAEPETLTGYFRRVFAAKPKLLRTRSNQEVLRRWQEDHPGQAVTEQIKAAMANAKSALRQKRKKRRGHKAAEAGQPTAAEQAAAPLSIAGPTTAHTTRVSRALEEQIDQCLDAAKELDRQGLETVIKVLLRARREVVWKMGQ